MEEISKVVGVAVFAVVIVGFAAVISGTFLWLIWPIAIPAAFPTLLGGAIAAKLTWWQAVCLTWLFGILIKATQTINK